MCWEIETFEYVLVHMEPKYMFCSQGLCWDLMASFNKGSLTQQLKIWSVTYSALFVGGLLLCLFLT